LDFSRLLLSVWARVGVFALSRLIFFIDFDCHQNYCQCSTLAFLTLP